MNTTYESHTIPRRSALKAIGGGLLLGAVAASPASARSDTLSHELNAVRTATQKYKDVDVARQDGYVLASPYVPGMGFHFLKPQLIAADEYAGPVDGIEKPPFLVYVTTGTYNPEPGTPHDPDRDGDLLLGAVEFGHVGSLGAPANYFSDEDGSRQLKTTEEAGWGQIPGRPVTALHAWVHRNNPAGVFHPTNPTVD